MSKISRKVRVCYVLAYHSPDYVRTTTLLAALERMENIELFQARNCSPGLWRYMQALGRLLYIRWFNNPDYYILGFRGHEIFWIVRLIVRGKFLIFDEFVSPYDAMVNERRKIRSGSLLSYLLYRVERLMLQAADLILTDTEAHRIFFSRLFRIPQSKIVALPIATDEKLFAPIIRQSSKNRGQDRSFTILFYGSFLPLHGIDIIVQVAFRLRDEPLHFILIGGNRQNSEDLREKIYEMDLHNVKHHRWVDFATLPELIDSCDLGLGGPFGNTGQGRRVVTGKTCQFLAMAKAVVVGQTEEDNGFIDKQNVLLVPQGDINSLTEAILWAFHNRKVLEYIGCQGRCLYDERFSLKIVEQCWRKILPN